MGFHEEQEIVWGSDGAWRQAIEHVQAVDAAMIQVTTGIIERGTTAEALYAVLVDGYLSRANPRYAHAAARLESSRPLILEQLRGALEFGTPPHLLPHVVVNPMLRGPSVLATEPDAELAPGPDSA